MTTPVTQCFNKNTHTQDLEKDAQDSFIHNSQNLGTAKYPWAGEWMNKTGNNHTSGQNNKEQLATDTHDNMDILKNTLSKRSQAEKNIYSI